MKFAILEETVRYKTLVSCKTCRHSLYEPGVRKKNECYCLIGRGYDCPKSGYRAWELEETPSGNITIIGFEEVEL